MTGTIPWEIQGLQNLVYLDLHSNNFGGSILTEIGNLTLEVLKLNENNLIGSIPTEIGFLNSTLEVLRLDGNALTGPIPTKIGFLSNLRELRLEGNQLTGTIPTEITLLEHLEILTVDAALEGSIPSHVKTLEPCILCEEGAISGMDTISSVVFENDDQHTIEGVSCANLSEGYPHALLSFDACEALREHCVTCDESPGDAFPAVASPTNTTGDLNGGSGSG